MKRFILIAALVVMLGALSDGAFARGRTYTYGSSGGRHYRSHRTTYYRSDYYPRRYYYRSYRTYYRYRPVYRTVRIYYYGPYVYYDDYYDAPGRVYYYYSY